jgi:hypothetical protein
MYLNFSKTVVTKNCFLANKEENDESISNWNSFLDRLKRIGVYSLISMGREDEALKIIHELEKDYEEKNIYYQELKQKTGIDYYTLRNEDCGVILSYKITRDISTKEIELFKKEYKKELEYFLSTQLNYSYMDFDLYKKLFELMLMFSVILRCTNLSINNNIDINTTNQDILNNFLVSHGFLLFNSVQKSKKAAFALKINQLYKSKASYNVIIDIIDLLTNKSAEFFEYYLFFDESKQDYYFLRVKPEEDFIYIYKNLYYERIVDFDQVVIEDPSWYATKEDLMNKNIKFLKSKYFSTMVTVNLNQTDTNLAFLINKLKRYRTMLKQDYLLEIEEYGTEKFSLLDFITFTFILSLKVKGINISELKETVLNIKYFKNKIIHNQNWEGKYRNDDSRNLLLQLVSETYFEQSQLSQIQANMSVNEPMEFEEEVIPSYISNNYKRYSDYKSDITTNLNNEYRNLIDETENDNISVYDYLSGINKEFKNKLEELEPYIIKDNFFRALELLEMTLSIYGQKEFGFAEQYLSLNLRDIKLIIDYFKSIVTRFIEVGIEFTIEENKEEGLNIFDRKYNMGIKIKEEHFSSGSIFYEEPTTNKVIEENNLESNTGNYINPIDYLKENFVNPYYVDGTESETEVTKKIEELLNRDDVLIIGDTIIDLGSISDKINKCTSKNSDEYKNIGITDSKEIIKNIITKYPNLLGNITRVFDIATYKFNSIGNSKDKVFYDSHNYYLLYKDMPLKIEDSDILFEDYENFANDSVIDIQKMDTTNG